MCTTKGGLDGYQLFKSVYIRIKSVGLFLANRNRNLTLQNKYGHVIQQSAQTFQQINAHDTDKNSLQKDQRANNQTG